MKQGRRSTARTADSKPANFGSNPNAPAKSEHGIAAGASGLQPDDARSTRAARSNAGVIQRPECRAASANVPGSSPGSRSKKPMRLWTMLDLHRAMGLLHRRQHRKEIEYEKEQEMKP